MNTISKNIRLVTWPLAKRLLAKEKKELDKRNQLKMKFKRNRLATRVY